MGTCAGITFTQTGEEPAVFGSRESLPRAAGAAQINGRPLPKLDHGVAPPGPGRRPRRPPDRASLAFRQLRPQPGSFASEWVLSSTLCWEDHALGTSEWVLIGHSAWAGNTECVRGVVCGDRPVIVWPGGWGSAGHCVAGWVWGAGLVG